MRDQRKIYYLLGGLPTEGIIQFQYRENGNDIFGVRPIEDNPDSSININHVYPRQITGMGPEIPWDNVVSIHNGQLPELDISGYLIYDFKEQKYIAGDILQLKVKWVEESEFATIFETEDDANLAMTVLQNSLGKNFLQLKHTDEFKDDGITNK